jgi:hypothetical protein
MAKICWMSVVILCCTLIGFGQQPAPTPPPAPNPTPVAVRQQPINPRQMSMPPATNPMAGPPGFGSPIEADPMARRLLLVQRYAIPLYRKPSGKELRLLAPDPSLAATYSEVLKRDDSGIFKLVADAGCAENTKVVNASEKCLKYLFPGAGNSFSFRTQSYRVRQLADITYVAGDLLMTGVLMNGIMVDLGNVPIEQVSLQTPAIGFINDIKPIGEFSKALEVDKWLTGGVRKDGYLYRRNLPVAADHTYVIRSIAYQGRVMRAVRGAEYNELDFDKRVDALTAFRIAKVDEDGTLTIVWTKLTSGRAPKLKVPNKVDNDRFTGGNETKLDNRPER